MMLQNPTAGRCYQALRRKLFAVLSDRVKIDGTPLVRQPTLFLGRGRITFGTGVQIGYFPSPHYYTGCCHFECRTENSTIILGNNVVFNNNFVSIAENEIRIGNDSLVGPCVEIMDSDFHNTDPARRLDGSHSVEPVYVGNNVFIGAGVRILKGARIGDNSVIASGAVVVSDIPENVIAGGVPAKPIRSLDI